MLWVRKSFKWLIGLLGLLLIFSFNINNQSLTNLNKQSTNSLITKTNEANDEVEATFYYKWIPKFAWHGWRDYDEGYWIIKTTNEDRSLITSANIPTTYNDGEHGELNVLGVGCPIQYDTVFRDCHKLKNVNLPKKLVCINDDAFLNCSSLKSIEFPNTLSYIGFNSFQSCTSLTSLNIPSSVTEIWENAFFGCTSISYIKFNKNKNLKLTYSSFALCSSLTSVDLSGVNFDPETKSLEVFAECRKLTKHGINISDTNLHWLQISENGQVVTFDTVHEWNDDAFAWGGLAYGDIDLSSYTNLTSTGIFAGSTNMKSITLPKQIKNITSFAFSGCNLSTITIPDSVTNIDEYSFISYYENKMTICFEQIDPTKITISSKAFVVERSLNKYFFATPFGNSMQETINISNAYKQALAGKISENDEFVYYFDQIKFDQNVIGDINDQALSQGQNWNLKDSVVWKSTKEWYQNQEKPIINGKWQHQFIIVDQNNDPVNLPSWLNFDDQTAVFSLNSQTQAQTLWLNNLRIKVIDKFYGNTYTSTKTFNIQIGSLPQPVVIRKTFTPNHNIDNIRNGLWIYNDSFEVVFEANKDYFANQNVDYIKQNFNEFFVNDKNLFLNYDQDNRNYFNPKLGNVVINDIQDISSTNEYRIILTFSVPNSISLEFSNQIINFGLSGYHNLFSVKTYAPKAFDPQYAQLFPNSSVVNLNEDNNRHAQAIYVAKNQTSFFNLPANSFKWANDLGYKFKLLNNINRSEYFIIGNENNEATFDNETNSLSIDITQTKLTTKDISNIFINHIIVQIVDENDNPFENVELPAIVVNITQANRNVHYGELSYETKNRDDALRNKNDVVHFDVDIAQILLPDNYQDLPSIINIKFRNSGVKWTWKLEVQEGQFYKFISTNDKDHQYELNCRLKSKPNLGSDPIVSFTFSLTQLFDNDKNPSDIILYIDNSSSSSIRIHTDEHINPPVPVNPTIGELIIKYLAIILPVGAGVIVLFIGSIIIIRRYRFNQYVKDKYSYMRQKKNK